MEWNIIHIAETDSTNRWLKERAAGEDCIVVADYQTAGRGQGDNRWESERGKNLLFSLLIHPLHVPANRQFRISMAVSLAIVEALSRHIGDVSIKWPNDIYWRNGKIAGILIEHTLQGAMIRDSIIGVGLNVNQRQFWSDAPNPVSIWQICEQETDREQLLKDILLHFCRLMALDKTSDASGHCDDVPDASGDSWQLLKARYLSMLYRRRDFHPYTDKGGVFMAELVGVEDDGHLLLRDDNGCERCYAFKEVQFVM